MPSGFGICCKKSNYTEDGYYLVLNACNENLHYALYQKTDDLFNREKEDVLEGLGTDVRSRALIENVVDYINEREYLLKTKEERESEYLRMNQFVDDWLVKLASARSYIPVELTNVTLSRDPFKNYPVPVKKSKIDERTDKIVKDIINVIVRFVKDAGVSHEQIKGILFLGNTFTNIQFKKELRSYYNLDDCKMVSYKDSDLSSLVSAYTFIDCSQFSAAQNVMRGNAEAELRRIKIAEEEAAAMKRAKEEADAKAAIEKEATEAERKFKDAMDMGFDAEREHDYDKMEEFFNIALTLRPDDEEAKQKHEEALRKKAELSVQQNHYKDKIQQAKAAYDENDYETAKFKAEEALSFMSDSKEALRIKEDSIRRIKSQKELERYLNRADLFIAQKAYSEAIQELQKAKLLDVDYKDIIERETRIKKEQQATNSRVEELSNQLNSALNEGRYDDAITTCNELIDVDFTNSRKWSARISDINITKERAVEDRKRWEKLVRDIDSAQWEDDWSRIITLCKEALDIKNDPVIRTKLEKAEAKFKTENELKMLDQTIAEIKDLILGSHFADAEKKLASLRRMNLDPSREAKVRDLNSLIFTKVDEAEQPKDPQGNPHPKPKKDPFDWDFGTPRSKPKQAKPATKPQKQKSNDEFFDSAIKANKPLEKKSVSKPSGKITNDDFNF